MALQKILSLRPVMVQYTCFVPFRRAISDDGTIRGRRDWIVLPEDGSCIACWHPESPFPYECSLPMPKREAADTDEVLKVKLKEDLSYIRRPKLDYVAIPELMKLTHTNKHIWYPR
ncbi:unnamed protein product [Darwinula stevensoni]|uniref:Large ribosomal subunit protein mL42 n=1 Tax=Darwinula stevensoni TaxID=69355 RepID=A0A7R9FQY8_9CRUS|nr:unnamed protein product [Darwinula stevensoni]CAG0900033.1 unnamed protein product [Darwinula stevensoni]